jgi:hypothetical protein
MVPSARKAALRMGLAECIAGRFARGPGPDSLLNVSGGLELGRRSLSGISMGFF